MFKKVCIGVLVLLIVIISFIFFFSPRKPNPVLEYLSSSRASERYIHKDVDFFIRFSNLPKNIRKIVESPLGEELRWLNTKKIAEVLNKYPESEGDYTDFYNTLRDFVKFIEENIKSISIGYYWNIAEPMDPRSILDGLVIIIDSGQNNNFSSLIDNLYELGNEQRNNLGPLKEDVSDYKNTPIYKVSFPIEGEDFNLYYSTKDGISVICFDEERIKRCIDNYNSSDNLAQDKNFLTLAKKAYHNDFFFYLDTTDINNYLLNSGYYAKRGFHPTYNINMKLLSTIGFKDNSINFEQISWIKEEDKNIFENGRMSTLNILPKDTTFFTWYVVANAYKDVLKESLEDIKMSEDSEIIAFYNEFINLLDKEVVIGIRGTNNFLNIPVPQLFLVFSTKDSQKIFDEMSNLFSRKLLVSDYQYKGIDYKTISLVGVMGFSLAKLDNYIIFSLDDKTIKDIIDTHDKESDSITKILETSPVKGRINKNNTAFFYMDTQEILQIIKKLLEWGLSFAKQQYLGFPEESESNEYTELVDVLHKELIKPIFRGLEMFGRYYAYTWTYKEKDKIINEGKGYLEVNW